MSHQLANKPASKIYRFDTISTALESAIDRQEFFASDLFREQFEIAVESIKAEDSVISVDIFDTLLLRDSVSEFKRFSLIAKEQCEYVNSKYNTTLKWQDFLAARLSGTKISYRASNVVDGCREGSIVDIYRVAARAIGLPNDAADELIDLELKHETTVLTPNKGLLELLRKYKAEGVRCIMISDMYLHAVHIRKLMDTLVPDHKNIFDEIYSSADSTVSKASQKIFPVIASLLDLTPNHWLHMGDAIKGDYRSPLNQKIKAIYLPIPSDIVTARNACEKQFLEELSAIGLNPKKFNS